MFLGNLITLIMSMIQLSQKIYYDRQHNNSYELTTDHYKKLICTFCDAMQLDNPVVMGCSMGGRIALHLALDYADQLSSNTNSDGELKEAQLIKLINRALKSEAKQKRRKKKR